ncbi:MAG: division/cell wall cluster transcriptional repressor MraZ [Clostridia bacterium]|nr:division/cell wall cluster transcriptional repressor MraZ [Clostridia bacterium]
MLLGEYSHTIDAKGRLFVPARYREELGESFIIAKYANGCIAVYSRSVWEKFVEKLLSYPDIKSLSTKRIIFSSAQEVEPDQQGRILVGAKLRSFAKLEKEVTIIGMSDHAEIWATDVFEEYIRENDDGNLLNLLGEDNF